MPDADNFLALDAFRPHRGLRLRCPRAALLCSFLAVAPALAGCGTGAADLVNEVGAVGVGGAVGAATGNPIVGIAAGLGASLAFEEGYNYAERTVYQSQQHAIAEAAGRTPVGDVAAWTHRGPLDLSANRGRVEVIRAFGEIASCKEFIYTFEALPPERLEKAGTYEGGGPVTPVDLDTDLTGETEVLVATACRRSEGQWAWAQSRPSTTRWGGLQ